MSTSKYNRISNNIKTAIIDQDGVAVDDEREFVNTPMAELFPDEKVVIIDWKAKDGQRPDLEVLREPVQYGAEKFYGAFAWGSAVKMGQTLGLTHDFPNELGMVTNAEDGQRVGRWLMAQGVFGGVRGKLRVKVVPAGTIINGFPVEDGCGLISAAVARTGYNGQDKIQLDGARESYTFWQRIPWDEVASEMGPHVRNHLIDLSSPEHMAFENSEHFEEKQKWLKIDGALIEHPYIANALSRGSKELFFKAATTVATNSVTRVAVPTTAAKIAVDEDGVAYRHPIDSWGSIQAVEADPADEAEVKRIEELELIQVTLASVDFFAKDTMQLVPSIPGGYDLVICSDDIKLAKMGVKVARDYSEIELDDAVLVFTQWFDKGSAIGINAAWAHELMGLDHDGDLVVFLPTARFPLLHKAVKGFPKGDTPKLLKTKTRITPVKDDRAVMIRKSMSNLVGFATNLMASTFMKVDRSYVAHRLGFSSVAKMDEALNYAIKVGTDGFKTQVDQERVEKTLMVWQSAVVKEFGQMAPWTAWVRNDWAFKHGVPSASPVDAMENWEKKLAVKDYMDGTVAQIARLTLPSLAAILKQPIKSRPLSYYYTWAADPGEYVMEGAFIMQDRFNARVQRINFTDPTEIAKFKLWFRTEVDKWIEAGGLERKEAACALWRAAHVTRSENAGGASIFMGMPAEAVWIVTEKPGLKGGGLQTLLLGVNQNLPARLWEGFTGTVEAVEYWPEARHGKQKARMVLTGRVCDEQTQKSGDRPDWMIGTVDKNKPQPEAGKYMATCWRLGEHNAWAVKLTKL